MNFLGNFFAIVLIIAFLVILFPSLTIFYIAWKRHFNLDDEKDYDDFSEDDVK